jgi:hypothetical protein
MKSSRLGILFLALMFVLIALNWLVAFASFVQHPFALTRALTALGLFVANIVYARVA